MKTSMNIIVFFVAFLSISAMSLAIKNSVEACIRRNIVDTLSPSPSRKIKIGHLEVIGDHFKVTEDDFCRDEGRIVMYFLRMNGDFPSYYVKALCKVFGDDDKKVKQYVIQTWLNLNSSKKLIHSFSCASL